MTFRHFAEQQCVVSIDGKIVPAESATLPVFDQAALLGYGLFETILAVENTPVRLRDHLARLNRSRRALGIHTPFSQTEVANIVRRAVRRHPARVKRARVTLTAGAGGFWSPREPKSGALVVIVLAHELSRDLPLREATLIESATADHWLSGHKTISRAPYMFPHPESPDYNSTSMSLLYSQQRGVTEFTNSAVLIRHGSTVIAPPLDSVLPGVTRKAALKALANSPDRQIRERSISVADLLEADEIIGLNALAPVFGVNLLKLPNRRPKSLIDNTLAEQLRDRVLPGGAKRMFR